MNRDALVAELWRRVSTIEYNIPGLEAAYAQVAEARALAFREVLCMLGEEA